MSIELPDVVFRNRTIEEQIDREQIYSTPIDAIFVNKGVWVWLQGAEYPQCGMVTPEMLGAMNVAKRMFMEIMRVASIPVIAIPILMYVIVSPKRFLLVEKLLKMYTETVYKVINDYIVAEDHQTNFSKELEWSIFFFVKQLGIDIKIASKLSEILSTLIQGDNAYRYRMMDFFEGMNVENFKKKPSKEIGRLINMLCSREKDGTVRKKFVLIGFLAKGALLIPEVKKALLITLDKVDINKLKFNEVDLYWALLYKDYNALGMSYAARQEYLGDAKKPELI